MSDLKLGQRIRKYRKLKHLSQEALCDKCQTLTSRQLSRIECGVSIPKVHTLMDIARQLQVSIDELLDFHL